MFHKDTFSHCRPPLTHTHTRARARTVITLFLLGYNHQYGVCRIGVTQILKSKGSNFPILFFPSPYLVPCLFFSPLPFLPFLSLPFFSWGIVIVTSIQLWSLKDCATPSTSHYTESVLDSLATVLCSTLSAIHKQVRDLSWHRSLRVVVTGTNLLPQTPWPNFGRGFGLLVASGYGHGYGQRWSLCWRC